jgi:sodium pump decarboxylase gamma subunit
VKKKISLILLVLTMALGLAGCGADKKSADYDTQSMETCADTVLQSFQAMSDADFDMLRSYSDFQLNYTLMSSGLPVANDDFLVMMDSYQNAVKEYGELINYGEFEVSESKDGPVLTTKAEFENKNADIVLNFDDEEHMTDMSVNIKYTIGQILEKAGMNTLIGMGTVFLVLIFIAFIISLFRFIPAIEAKFKGNAKEAKVEAPAKPAPAPAAPVAEAPAKSEMDQSQLIAVITAAIAASEGTSTDGFIVRSIKRRKNNNWK